MSAGIRDNGRQRLGDVQGELSDFVASVFTDGAGITVELTYGRLRAVRHRGGEAVVMVHGAGGGYCWEDTWSKKRLRSFLDETAPPNPEVRRAPPQEVWPR